MTRFYNTLVEESLESDRHHIDDTTWFDLQEKVFQLSLEKILADVVFYFMVLPNIVGILNIHGY